MSSFVEWCDSFTVSNDLNYTRPKPPSGGKVQCVNSELLGNDEVFGQQPFANGPVFRATASVERRISSPDGKDVFCLKLAAPELEGLDYEPGDTIGILPENNINDVEKILHQIDDNPDSVYQILNSDTKKTFLPKFSTPRILFTRFLSLKFIPLKQLLSVLAAATETPKEKQILEYLCSKEGAETYRDVILQQGTPFLQIICQLPSCRPSLSVLVGNLPRLLPRPYSIASSPSAALRIALSVLPNNQEGVCSGMLRRKLNETETTDCFVYLRKPHGFRLVAEDSAPLILVGPGTGVAVFLGFLDHLKFCNNRRTVYLFTGFRYKTDTLYAEEFDSHLKTNVLTKFFVSYSREARDAETKYVQQSLKNQWKDLGKLIVEQRAVIYECGDFKKMLNSVSDAFIAVLENYLATSKEEAAIKLKEMKQDKRYLQDIWS